MSKKELSRRDFLLRTGALSAVALGSGAILTACGGGQQPADTPAAVEESMPAEEPMAMHSACDDLTGLTDADIQMRQTLQYVSESPKPDQFCSNCQLYVPAAEGAACGGCTIIKGPIAPGGYCTSWAAKVT